MLLSLHCIIRVYDTSPPRRQRLQRVSWPLQVCMLHAATHYIILAVLPEWPAALHALSSRPPFSPLLSSLPAPPPSLSLSLSLLSKHVYFLSLFFPPISTVRGYYNTGMRFCFYFTRCPDHNNGQWIGSLVFHAGLISHT